MIVQVLLGETDSRTCGDAWATWGVVPKMGCARCDYEPDGCQRYVCGTVSSGKELQYVQSVTSHSVAVAYCSINSNSVLCVLIAHGVSSPHSLSFCLCLPTLLFQTENKVVLLTILYIPFYDRV